MTKTTTIFLLLIFVSLMSFSSKSVDESIYSSKYITYSVQRVGSTAVLKLDVANLEDYVEIFLRRSTNPTDDFRQVKFLAKKQLPSLANDGTIIDKYPLPGSIDAYYKVVAINKRGVYKLFPCVKLTRYQ